jgi:UDP-glucose 4-epimerase
LAGIVAREFACGLPVEHLPSRNEVVHAYASHEKANRLLNVEARVGLEEGIGRMAHWVRKVGVRHSKPFADIELTVNMPPSWAALSHVAVKLESS